MIVWAHMLHDLVSPENNCANILAWKIACNEGREMLHGTWTLLAYIAHFMTRLMLIPTTECFVLCWIYVILLYMKQCLKFV